MGENFVFIYIVNLWNTHHSPWLLRHSAMLKNFEEKNFATLLRAQWKKHKFILIFFSCLICSKKKKHFPKEKYYDSLPSDSLKVWTKTKVYSRSAESFKDCVLRGGEIVALHTVAETRFLSRSQYDRKIALRWKKPDGSRKTKSTTISIRILPYGLYDHAGFTLRHAKMRDLRALVIFSIFALCGCSWCAVVASAAAPTARSNRSDDQMNETIYDWK